MLVPEAFVSYVLVCACTVITVCYIYIALTSEVLHVFLHFRV